MKIIKILEQDLNETRIVMPLDSMEYLAPIGMFSTDTLLSKQTEADYLLIVYSDSLKCAPCKLNRFGIWHSIKKNAEEIGFNIDFVFVFHPRKDQVLEFRGVYYSKQNLISVFLDTLGVMEQNISFLRECRFGHAFVVNKNQRIEVVEDVGSDEFVERKYYKFIKSKMRMEQVRISINLLNY